MPNIATISSAVMLEIVLALADLGKDLFAGPVLHEEVAADCGIVGAQEGIGFLFDRDRRRNGEPAFGACCLDIPGAGRSEEHTSELQSPMRISYAVFCLKKKNSSS